MPLIFQGFVEVIYCLAVGRVVSPDSLRETIQCGKARAPGRGGIFVEEVLQQDNMTKYLKVENAGIFLLLHSIDLDSQVFENCISKTPIFLMSFRLSAPSPF
jgi:hypothetical protein